MKYLYWILGIILFLILILFFISKIALIRQAVNLPETDNAQNNTLVTNIKDDQELSTFQGGNLEFSFPKSWAVKSADSSYPAIETIDLGIPEAISDLLLIYPADYQQNLPADCQVIILNQKQIWKWTEKGENYFSLNYFMPTQKAKTKIIVTLQKEDKPIESQLDSLLDSLEFK